MHSFLATTENTLIRNAVAILVILVFSLLLAHFLTPFGSATTPDSLNYLDIARNFKSGHGLLATDRSLENYDGMSYREVKLWPPLYPLTLAASAFKLPDAATASRLSAVLLALTAVFAYLLLAPLMKWYFALLASILLCLSTPLITVYTYAWSETLFIPLLLLAVWAATRYLEAEAVDAGRRYRLLGVLVISLVALAYTRYIGIALSLLLPATFLQCEKKRRALPAFVVAAGVYALAVGYLLASNYRVTGSITGGARSPSDISFRDNLFDMLSVLDASIPSSPLLQLLVLVAAMCIALVYTRLAAVSVQAQPQPVSHRPVRNILLFVGVLYIGVIFLLRMYRNFDMLDMRLLAPALVVLWLLMLVVLAQLQPVNIMRLAAQILLWFCVIVFPVKGYTRFQDSIHSWRVLGSPDHRANAGVSYMNYTSTQQANPVRELLAGLLSGNAVVVAERPLIFEFMSGKRSLQLPETIDIDVIGKFNALPAGSLILLPNGKQQKTLFKLRLEHNLSYEYLKLGQGIAVRTPIVFVPED